MMKYISYILVLSSLFVLTGCRERPVGQNVEAYALGFAASTPTPMLDLTVEGTITCSTCYRSTTAMIVELWHHNSVGNQPIVRRYFDYLGPYRIEAQVAHESALDLKVMVIAAGVIRYVDSELEAPADTSLAEVAQTIDLHVGEVNPDNGL